MQIEAKPKETTGNNEFNKTDEPTPNQLQPQSKGQSNPPTPYMITPLQQTHVIM